MQENKFNIFNLDSRLIEKLNKKRINIPTRIQEDVIPKILNEKDVIAQSKTGTGKTIAYLLPVLHLLTIKKNKILIIAPTKELAIQIFKEIEYFSDGINIKSILLISGDSIDEQKRILKIDNDIIIGVPGRIIKLAEEGVLKFNNIKKIILDEADFLIELGFIDDIKFIIEKAKNLAQLMVFSATLSNKTKHIIDNLKENKHRIKIDSKTSLPENIKNYFFHIEDDERDKILLQILNIINPFLCIIFVRTKETSKYVYDILKKNKYNIGLLNGDLPSSHRKKVINDFKSAKIQYLIATDLASRGLDVESITHIINYNLPLNELDYLHRGGRTGRMNDEGIIYSICNILDEGYLRKYALILNIKIIALKIKNNQIIYDEKYKGVKARLNLNELKKQEKLKIIKKKERENYEQKKRRNRKKR